MTNLVHDEAKSERVWSIYCALWKQAQSDGVACVYYHFESDTCPIKGLPEGEKGAFVLQDIWPTISITRHSVTGQPDEEPSAIFADGTAAPILDELVTLAHEHGHFTSWKRKERTAEYAAALDRFAAQRKARKATDPGDAALIVDEERRAWRIGRETLTALGFDDWPAFDARELEGLKIYDELFRSEKS